MSNQKLLIVDGFSLAFRAYYGFPLTLRTSEGKPINVVYGFLTLLFKALSQFSPSHVVVCFDVKEPTFRHKMFVDYKAHRPPPPDDFVVQIDALKSSLMGCGFSLVEEPGFEADDIMGTLSTHMSRQDVKSLLMTGDHDAYQLVDEFTSVVAVKKGVSDLVTITPIEINEKYALTPKQIVDFKALKGDSSDNIPGVKGIGDKTATQLLHAYHTLKGVYDNVDSIASKSVQLKLRANKENAFLSYELATINCQVPTSLVLDDFLFEYRWEQILALFESYQFYNLTKKYASKGFSNSNVEKKSMDMGTYKILTTEKELQALLPLLANGFSIHLETTSEPAQGAQILGIALSVSPGEAYYLVCKDAVKDINLEQTLSMFAIEEKPSFKPHSFLTMLTSFLIDESVPKITHDGKYVYLVLLNYGVVLKGIVFDTMLAAFLLVPGEQYGLEALSKRHLNVSIKGVDHQAAVNADMVVRLKHYFEPKLKEKELESLLLTLELPAQIVLAKMERAGVCLDTVYLAKIEKEFTFLSEELTQKIHDAAGVEFNINSPKQLGDVLFDKMQLPVLKKTKTGRSTDFSVLEKLQEYHDIAKYLVSYRTIEKLLSTYVKTLPGLVSSYTKRIHTSFNQTGAITGRLSSTNPNLQNIPIRSDEGKRIRQAFVPSSSQHVIVSVDYSQIELRLMAHLSEDENMIKAFNNGEDIHVSTAAIINDIEIAAVTKDQRYHAKAVNFGIIYGISSFGLSENLGISKLDAKAIITNYFEKFPTIKIFIEKTLIEARKAGYVQTLFGRYRYVPEINDAVFHRRQFAERAAVNTRLQGTAADIIKLAMIRIQDQFEAKRLKSKMVIQVHDELVFDVLNSELDIVKEWVGHEMQRVVELKVPLTVDIGVGPNWLEVS